MPEVKFLQQNHEDPSLYLDELKGAKGPPAVYVIPTDEPHQFADPFSRSPSPQLLDPQWSRGPRCPDPERSKKAAIADPTQKSTRTNRVTIRLPNSDPKGDSTKGTKSLGSPVSDGITNGNDSHDKPAEKPPNICSRLLGGCAQKLPCCAKLACHKKQPELQIVDEKAAKKKASKDTAKKTKPDAKGGALSKLNCCRKKVDADSEMADMTKTKPDMNAPKAEEEPSPGCLSCCKKKNKIRDSSADRRNVTDEHWWHKMGCCKSKQRKQQDWAARRDSILSTPTPPPGCFGKLKQKLSCKKGANQSDESRRTSLFSKKRSLSQAVPIEDSRSKLDTSLIEHNSHMRGAIPALPVPLAWFCFVCNILVPGLGTICSGLFCLCFGRPRFGMYDGYRQRIGAFLIDLIVGIGQLFTVLFCLVGWGWSIWWGSMMIKVARKYKKLRLAALDPERAVPTTNNHRAART